MRRRRERLNVGDDAGRRLRMDDPDRLRLPLAQPRADVVRLGRACREGAKAMGLELFSPDEDRSAVVTAIRAPDGIDSTEIVATLRDRFGITIAGGQGELLGKIFRLGHIGWFDVFDITTSLAALELTLADAGADIERGVAVTRALEAYETHAAV